MIETVLLIIFFTLVFIKILGDIYLFQIKEYRLDRIVALLHDKRFVQTFITFKKMPAKTLRNTLIVFFSTGLLVLHVTLIKGTIFLILLNIVFYFFISFALTYMGVFISGIFAGRKRQSIISKAHTLLTHSKVVIIGITGSYGKTTTKEYLFHILSQKYKVAKTDTNMNTDVGIALSILKNLKSDTQYFIAEMGAYRIGEIKKICNMVKPTYGVITALGNQHLDLFGSRENLFEAKKELLISLPKNGKAFVNKATVSEKQLKEGINAPVIFYNNSDQLPLNIAPCILLAQELGMSKDEISKGINVIKQTKSKTDPIQGLKQSTIINNSYSTNVEGFIHSIELLNKRKERKKIIISRGIIELGKEKTISYERILHVLVKSEVDLYTTDADFKRSSILNVHYFKNEQQLSSSIMNILDQETVVLFEGRYDNSFINQIINNP